jgi:hypothetical protein
MEPVTLIINFKPEIKKETPSALRNKEYADNILNKYNLGKVLHCNENDYRDYIKEHNPFVIILTSQFLAEQISEENPDILLFLTDPVTSIFSRKIDIADKQKKQQKVFKNAEELVQKIRESDEKERKEIRKFSSMSYNDLYKMIKQALVGDDEELKKKAWDLLFGKGERHSNFLWMKMQLLCETWEKTDNKGREQLMCMTMDQFIDEGFARKIDSFKDKDGQEYHQYMIINFYGQDTGTIRKIPFGEEKVNQQYDYQALLKENDVPENFTRMNMELNQIKDQREKFWKDQR